MEGHSSPPRPPNISRVNALLPTSFLLIFRSQFISHYASLTRGLRQFYPDLFPDEAMSTKKTSVGVQKEIFLNLAKTMNIQHPEGWYGVRALFSSGVLSQVSAGQVIKNGGDYTHSSHLAHKRGFFGFLLRKFSLFGLIYLLSGGGMGYLQIHKTSQKILDQARKSKGTPLYLHHFSREGIFRLFFPTAQLEINR